jgi:hypothetical protein
MQYITGIHALNVPCALETCGDWHASALRWEQLSIKETKNSVFGDYGIEHSKSIPNHYERYDVANHIRAVLDLIEDGNFSTAAGMNNDFICTDIYDKEIFSLVMKMKGLPLWEKIDEFMRREYRLKWVKFMKGATDI